MEAEIMMVAIFQPWQQFSDEKIVAMIFFPNCLVLTFKIVQSLLNHFILDVLHPARIMTWPERISKINQSEIVWFLSLIENEDKIIVLKENSFLHS